jgi:hypothetical protein
MKSDVTLLEEVQVIFRFVGDNVNPSVITSKINLQPSVAHAKGEVVKKHPKHVYPTGFWSISSSVPSDCTLEEHLENLLDILEPKALLIKELRDDGIVPDFYCGCFIAMTTASVKITTDTLRRIADIGASLEYHLYCGDEDD